MAKFIVWFKNISLKDVELVGGKNASLGEMYCNLTSLGVKVPNGFAITSEAYNYFFEQNGILPKLHKILDNLDYNDIKKLQQSGKECRKIITDCQIPGDLKEDILKSYRNLKKEYGNDISVAVRSSATAEDSLEASFAGQNETFLNIYTEKMLLDAYKECLASNFTDRSLHYKYLYGFDWSKVFLSVVVMKMVRSDIGSSGVMFTIDTESGFKDVVFINSAWGLGENIVQGVVEPDIFYVYKPTFKKGYRAVLKRKLGKKELKMVFRENEQKVDTFYDTVKNVETTDEERDRYSLSDEDVMVLTEYAIKVEEHYSKSVGSHRAMDIEWAKDGVDGDIYLVQARPETVESKKSGSILKRFKLKKRSKVLVTGHAVGASIGVGRVKIVNGINDLKSFKAGEILVAKYTSPDWEPAMKIASAVVTERGGRTCHAAIVSRELGIPAIVGASGATEKLKNGLEVTVSCAEGEVGSVYEGMQEFEVEEVDLSALSKPKTKIMMNLGNPDIAFSLSSLPVDGVGLARMEFIINEYIKAHPMALKYPKKIDKPSLEKIKKLAKSFSSFEEFFITTLSEGVATIAASVYPKPCIVRMSDFKSNEYSKLIGGEFFEPVEENPMIGFRGASRYYHPAYKEGFAMECKAIKRVRDVMGFDNVILMIPFCRNVEEGRKVLETMGKFGLNRGENGLKVYMMCELPNNAILIDEFCQIFDGISIGSNDLTQLTLGVDRDNEIVSFDFDEMDKGVLKLIKMSVEGAKRNGRYCGICGQAPSDHDEMAKFLVDISIDSISLNPDAVLKTIKNIVMLESKRSI